MVDKHDLEIIYDYLTTNYTEIDWFVGICDDYIEDKDSYISILNKFKKLKEKIKKYKSFSNNQKKGVRKGNRASWISNIKEYWKVGNIELTKLQISVALTDFRVFHSKTTLWRFKKELKEMGIPESFLIGEKNK